MRAFRVKEREEVGVGGAICKEGGRERRGQLHRVSEYLSRTKDDSLDAE